MEQSDNKKLVDETQIVDAILGQIKDTIKLEVIDESIRDQFGLDSKEKVFSALLDPEGLKYSIRQTLIGYKKELLPDETFDLMS